MDDKFSSDSEDEDSGNFVERFKLIFVIIESSEYESVDSVHDLEEVKDSTTVQKDSNTAQLK